MSADAGFFRLGERVALGSHCFTAPEIIAFAQKYDRQPFHTDPVAAGNSLFGGLCASGWHTCAVWMRLNVENSSQWLAEAAERGDHVPTLGPSPGFRDLRWRRPVFAGDTIAFFRTNKSLRPSASMSGWSILVHRAEAAGQAGETVMEFEAAVLVRRPARQAG